MWWIILIIIFGLAYGFGNNEYNKKCSKNNICPKCGGSGLGSEIYEPCDTCHGSGKYNN